MIVQKKISLDALPTELGSGGATGDEGGFSLTDLMRMVRIRRRIILGAATVVVVLATVIVMQLTPIYTASSVVMLDQRKNSVADSNAVLSTLPVNDASTIQNQVQILTSTELVGRVVDKLKLIDDAEFNPKVRGGAKFWAMINPLQWLRLSGNASGSLEDRDAEKRAVVDRVVAGIKVGQVGVSTAMLVSFNSTDAGKAARIANAISDAYVDDQLEAKFDATRKATQWLSTRIDELSRQAMAADAAVQRYKAEHNISETQAGSVVDQQINNISQQMVLAKTELAEKTANYQQLESLARIGKAANSAQVLASPLIGALQTQESTLASEMANMASKYGPRHPRMVDLQAQKENLDARITAEVQRVVDAARNEVSATRAHLSSLEGSLAQIESRGAGQNEAGVQLKSLQSEATTARAMYESFLGRLNQAKDQQGIQAPDSRVISRAQPPKSPSFPKKTLIIGASIPIGLLLGLMLAFLAERLDAGFRTSNEVERLLRYPVLSTIPEVDITNGSTVPAAERVIDQPTSSYTEAVRGLLLRINCANVDEKPKVIIVTSSVPGEGKTITALSLARIAARGGAKTVLIEADLRRPTIAKVAGLTGVDKGIIEALVTPAELDTCFYKDPKSDLVILPCVGTPQNPAEFLSSNLVEKLVDQLRRNFDIVIVDSPPVLPVNDTRVLSRLGDALVFVVRWEVTPRAAALSAIQALEAVRAPITGIVMSRADSERFRYYNYGYQNYSNYGKYYSE